ncbi:isopentenyl-diphosphate Delta-isomerase [candidate division KSB1 bacterium]|nr:isopentenyl-diphosphate Delta-isomerase [candidate division KSB1 bacterium]NIR69880.1 isopentenyl-diphosphate Delta-isomerase [candidate division KSB1 bacterium]NIS28033.1 isopentenyl-diphosphate Delta-isomerase [candidate division KSB1 bacterium]NIT74904.1 isopentenyl-diphosphate Delta-isomerase [candidate division KSB1 bacterium]NIU28688.1 isopentenyl-diphosphate Delta-isomerase [candidate division KSB1 bacterium]
MDERVILVDESDRQIGVEKKLKAHREAKLHRAFSIFVFNSRDELLLQRRAFAKYHSGGLWSNTCCSHPRPSEPNEEAAHRRLREEMGIVCKLWKAFDFIYKAKMEQGLVEHELDHVFVGGYDGEVIPNPEEVMDYRWLAVPSLRKDLQESPRRYTPWFKIALDRAVESWLSLRGPL